MDCNSGAYYFSGGWWINNTINNTFDASITIEGSNGQLVNTYGGCTQYHMLGNVFQQGGYANPGLMPIQGGTSNNITSSMYWAYAGNIQSPRDGQNNVWSHVSGGSVFRNTASCANWLTGNFTENGSTDGERKPTRSAAMPYSRHPTRRAGLQTTSPLRHRPRRSTGTRLRSESRVSAPLTRVRYRTGPPCCRASERRRLAMFHSVYG